MDLDVTGSSWGLKSFGDACNAKIMQKPEYRLVRTDEIK